MNQKIINKSKDEVKKQLQTKITTLQKELDKAQKDLENIDDYVVIKDSMIDKPFSKLGLQDKNTLYRTNKSIFEWFNIDNEGDKPNKNKSLQDYIDEYEPAGKLNFYEI